MDYDDPVQSHVALRFLEQFAVDREAGSQRSLADYLEQFPDFPDLIRQEYAASTGEKATSTVVQSSSPALPPQWSSTMTLGLPCDFGPYELLEEIGRGGMGVVYKARQKELERIVAIKMILARHLASPEHVDRFRAEAKAAASLRHSHIVQIHEVGQLCGQYYFTMDYVEGSSLAEQLDSGALPFRAGAQLMAQVARAVGYCHREGIIHRDLKPSNILVDPDGHPYVSDFGLAKVLLGQSQMTLSGEILGTASYMAPEQASGQSSEATPASDVYSLGAMLYELLTGQPPFCEDNPIVTLIHVRTKEPTLPRRLRPEIPRRLELVCTKCLAKSPGERYESAEELADDLERFLRGESLTARPPSLFQRFWNWSRREPALATRLVVLTIFFLIEWIIYSLTTVADDNHSTMVMILAVWATAACAFQQLLKIPRWTLPGQYLWGALDAALLFTVLLLAKGIASPLIVGYPLLVVASGLWFRVRFVWLATALSTVSYGIHLFDFYVRRIHTDLSGVIDDRWDRHVVFAVALFCIGGIVAYLVHRVQVLSSYFDRKD